MAATPAQRADRPPNNKAMDTEDIRVPDRVGMQVTLDTKVHHRIKSRKSQTLRGRERLTAAGAITQTQYSRH